MQRRVDQEDYRSLARAKAAIDGAFSSGGTDWFPDEQANLHDASAAVAGLLDSLRQESAIKAIASRIVTAAWQVRQAKGLGGFQKGDRVRRKSDGMEGDIDYVGSGPRGDSLSVLWDNPVQRIMGPDIVKPGTVEKARA